MRQNLLLTVYLHDGRYHGRVAEWPPSPARVFQALVAGAARGATLNADVVTALEWLESLHPPVIAAPRARVGSAVHYFVPNNDADTSKVSGDPSKIGDLRVQKVVQPHLIEGAPSFTYAWSFDDDGLHADRLVAAALDIYQLGKGVDMAWAVAELVDDDILWERLSRHQGTVHEPRGDDSEGVLPCPTIGSLRSLVRRFNSPKLRTEGEGRKAVVLYANQPKPEFVPVSYRRSKRRLLFELRRREEGRDGELRPWPLRRVVALTERLRDAAAERLRQTLPVSAAADIERTVVGQKADGRDAIAPAERVQIVPLPSIGHRHADMAIRRFLLDVPSDGSVRTDDLIWSFSGLQTCDFATGELDPFMVTRSVDHRMLAHYGGPSRTWRTITPIALPENAARRRIEPARRREEAKGARERAIEEARAVEALRSALRHAGIRARLVAAQVRREPFDVHGARADEFASGTRFAKERLWHASLEFSDAVHGPIRLGDGRFLGLGLMAPGLQTTPGLHAFVVAEGLAHAAPTGDITHALRRAVMARAQTVVGREEPLPAFFSGHGADGGPARSEVEPHLAFAFDQDSRRLLVLAPHVVERRLQANAEHGHLRILDSALQGFHELIAGASGRLRVQPTAIDSQRDPFFAASRTWETVTPYVVTHHGRGMRAEEAFAADLLSQCKRVGLPEPRVESRELRGVAGVGLAGHARMVFDVSVPGPILLGKTRFLGGGLFRCV